MAVALDSATARYSALCRLCATKTGLIQGINVFANEANYRQIFKKIEACLPIQISETDALPKIVCENCLYKVELLFDFRERALRTETVLVELFKQLHSHPMQIHNGNHVQHLKLDIVLEHVLSQQSNLLNEGLSHVSDIELPQLSHRDSMIILSEHNVPLDQLSQHDINQELSNHSIDTSENILGGPNGYNAMEYQHHGMLNEDINLAHTNMHHQMKTMIDHQDNYAGLSDLGHVKNMACNGVQRLMMNEAHFMHNNLNVEENLDALISSMFCTTCGKSFDDKVLLQTHYQEHYSKACNSYPHEKELDNSHRKELHGASSNGIEINTPSLDIESEIHQIEDTPLNIESPEIQETLPPQLDIPLEESVKPQAVIANESLQPNSTYDDYNDEDNNDFNLNESDSDTHYENNLETNETETSVETESKKSLDLEENFTQNESAAIVMKKTVEPKVCNICDKQFSRNSTLRQHMRKHNGDNPYKCNICDKSFRSKIGLSQHEANHTGQFDYLCTTCGKGFQIKSYLRVHERTHSDVKPFSCATCQQNFKSKQALLDHTNRHLGLKPHQCPICRKSYITKSILKAHHKKVHSGVDNRKHPCSLCDKYFVSKSYLNTHMRIHKGEKPHKCEVCEKGFQTKVDLKVHFTKHSGEKSFVCEICGKAFARRDALRCHRRSHTGERPYKCDICGQTFTQFSPMAVHRRGHTGEKPYECEDCGEKFVSRPLMLAHRKKHIKNEIGNENIAIPQAVS